MGTQTAKRTRDGCGEDEEEDGCVDREGRY